MSKKLIILGSNGMLGQMVNSFFKKEGYDIICYNERFNEHTFDSYLAFLNALEPSVIINCVGRIKQKTDDPFDLVLSNSLFPLELARSLKEDHFLIHPSTDCVFDGQMRSKYSTNSKHTAKDVYGWSKSLGEKAVLSRRNSLVVRVSIIGPDYKTNRGLLGWFLSVEEHSKVNGFENHYWNGITTLEWCKQLFPFVKAVDLKKSSPSLLIQLGTDVVYTKFEMLGLFQKVFGTNLEIERFETPESINRSLESDKGVIDLEKQLFELKAFLDDENCNMPKN